MEILTFVLSVICVAGAIITVFVGLSAAPHAAHEEGHPEDGELIPIPVENRAVVPVRRPR